MTDRFLVIVTPLHDGLPTHSQNGNGLSPGTGARFLVIAALMLTVSWSVAQTDPQKFDCSKRAMVAIASVELFVYRCNTSQYKPFEILQ